MKTIFAIALAACTLAACNDNNATDTTSTDSMSTESTVTTTEPAPPAVVTRTPMEGDVSYREGKVRVYRNNTWEDANEDVKLENGVIIRRSGRAVKDGNEVEWEEGYVVDREGNVWDRTGNAISDAWDATKHGVKKAGKEVGEAAEKVGDKVKDAVN